MKTLFYIKTYFIAFGQKSGKQCFKKINMPGVYRMIWRSTRLRSENLKGRVIIVIQTSGGKDLK